VLCLVELTAHGDKHKKNFDTNFRKGCQFLFLKHCKTQVDRLRVHSSGQ
jgi:hypothetical protein